MFGDPPTRGELADLAALESSPGGVVHGLETGMARAQLGFLQGPREPPVLPVEPFRLDEQREPLVEGQRRDARVLLFWEPRTGKTRACVVGMWLLHLERHVQRFLVVCPKTVAAVWKAELCGGPWEVLNLTNGPLRTRKKVLQAARGNTHVVVVNYDAVPSLLPTLQRWRPEFIICDESHYIKSSGARRSRALHRLGRMAPYRRILTGTPDPRDYADYYSQMRFLNPTVFGTDYWSFRNRYLIMHPLYRSNVIGYRHVAELRERIFSVASRVRREECLGIPDVQDIVRLIDIGSRIRTAYYEPLARDPSENKLHRLLLLQQLTSGFLPRDGGYQWLHSQKIEAVLGELDEVFEAGGKAVVFCRFRVEQERLANAISQGFPRTKVSLLHGDTPQAQRDALLQEFSERAGPMAVVCQISMGLGISFAAADLAIYTSLTFNCADYEQSRARIWKPNGKLVYAYVMVGNSVDSFILDVLKHKQSVSAALLDGLSWEGITHGNGWRK